MADDAGKETDEVLAYPPVHPPLRAAAQVRSLDDIRLLEQTPLGDALPQRSTYELIHNSKVAFGDRIALTFLHTGDPAAGATSWSFHLLFAKVTQYANVLHALGLGQDDVQAILLPACLEYQLGLWGGAAAGIAQPLNPLLSEDKLAALLAASGAKALLAWGADAEAGIWRKAMRLRAQVPSLRHVVRVAPLGEDPSSALELPPGVHHLQALMERQPADRLVSGRRIAPEDIAAYFHTGGTTGAPKIARQTHGGQVYTCWGGVLMSGVTPDDVTINGSPQFHVAGALVTGLSSIAAGLRQVVPTTTLFRNPEVVRNYWRIIEHFRVTLAGGVPTVMAAVCQVPIGDADIGSLRHCRSGAAVLPAELAARWERLTGHQVHEMLGMTETSGVATVTPPGAAGPAGTVGFRLPHMQLRVVQLDPDGQPSDREVAPGQPGVILYQGPNVFAGYLDPADTGRSFTRDGWFVSGDIGWIDEQQRLRLSGRSKDLIIRSGHNIDPKVIEDAVGAHPAVKYAAAVGAPDAYAGELPVVFVALHGPGLATAEELLQFAAARVDEPPARPRRVHVVDTMPMTSVGKIYKPQLRALAAQATAQLLIEQVGARHGVPAHAQPRAVCTEAEGLAVTLGSRHDAAFEQALRAALAELPLQNQRVRRASP